jgi:hypothetical protein
MGKLVLTIWLGTFTSRPPHRETLHRGMAHSSARPDGAQIVASGDSPQTVAEAADAAGYDSACSPQVSSPRLSGCLPFFDATFFGADREVVVSANRHFCGTGPY